MRVRREGSGVQPPGPSPSPSRDLPRHRARRRRRRGSINSERLRHPRAFSRWHRQAFDNRNADLLFQVVSCRYERKSLVLTTNLAFKEWASIFPNATCATALIDRVSHHADVINVEGKSYRLREAEDAAVKKENAKSRPRK